MSIHQANNGTSCGEPTRQFSKLTAELQQQKLQGGAGERGTMFAGPEASSSASAAATATAAQDFHGPYFNGVKPTVGGPTTSAAGTFLVAHASTSRASCFIDPLRVLNKSPLDTLLARSPAKEKTKESSSAYLADTFKYFDKQVWLNRGVAIANTETQVESTPAPPTATESTPPSADLGTLSTRDVSSPYVSVNEDYDVEYHEVSDVDESEPEIDQYVLEAKSKDSFLNIIYEDGMSKKPKKPKHSGSDVSNDSVLLESGYKSNHSCPATPPFPSVHRQASSDEVIKPIARRIELVSSTPTCGGSTSMVCRSFMSAPSASNTSETIATNSSPEDSSEQISKLIVDLIGPHSRVGKLIFQSCPTSQDMECILEEIKQCVQADLQVEDKLTSFFRNQHTASANNAASPASSANSGAVVKYDTLRNLDDTLAFIKVNISQIRDDFNEFKEHSFQKIDAKVNYTEFSDATAVLHAKMTHLERKIFNDQRIMRQDIRSCREKINFLENEASCGLKNFPVWPFIAFIGAYSIINLGRR